MHVEIVSHVNVYIVSSESYFLSCKLSFCKFIMISGADTEPSERGGGATRYALAQNI